MQGKKAILFDFDYTLGDSTNAVAECVNYALAELGHKPADMQSIRRTIGLSLVETYCTLTGPQSPDACKEFTRLFIEKGDHVMVSGTTFYPGARDAILELRRRGLSTGIVSTKLRYRLEAVLDREQMRDLFDVLIGGEDVAHHKPAPEPLLRAADKLGLTPGECIYVGDSLTDAETAQRAGMPFVAITTGVTPAEEFARYTPTTIIHDLKEVARSL